MLVTVLGAGYMGSAMAQVAAMRGHTVRLWGTWLDDELVTEVEQLISHVLPMRDIQAAFELSASHETAKIILQPWA